MKKFKDNISFFIIQIKLIVLFFGDYEKENNKPNLYEMCFSKNKFMYTKSIIQTKICI